MARVPYFVAAPGQLIIGGAKLAQGALALEEECANSHANDNENTQSGG